jgi:hypothetical protein
MENYPYFEHVEVHWMAYKKMLLHRPLLFFFWFFYFSRAMKNTDEWHKTYIIVAIILLLSLSHLQSRSWP